MGKEREKYNRKITKLLYSVKRGDKRKMEELFEATFHHFYGYAIVNLLDKSRAEDAVMSMYENVMRYIMSFDEKKNGSGWMFTILNRIIYDYNADETAIRQNEQPLNETLAVNRMYDTIGLSDIVSGLDDVDRKIVFMYYFERRTLSEIAETFKLSATAIHKRMKQITKKLDKSFNGG